METNKVVKEYLGTGKIAKLFGVAPRTVAKWIDNGIMQGTKIPGSKHRRVAIAEVTRFSIEHNIPFVESEEEAEEFACQTSQAEPQEAIILSGTPGDDFLGRKEV